MNRLLLVVGDASPETVRLALDGHPSHVRVVATTVVGPVAWLSNAEDDARLSAEMRALEAERALAGLVDVTSAAGPVDPVEAASEVLAEFPADDIFVGGSAADDELGRALMSLGLPVTYVGPPARSRARVNRTIRELASGRNAQSVLALVVGLNVALMIVGIALSLLVLLLLWVAGVY